MIEKSDLLFFPGDIHIANFFKTSKPVLYYGDANFCDLVDYYWFNLPKWNIKEGNKCEIKGIKRSDIVMKSSDWARRGAITHYGASKERTYVLEFGANIDDEDISVAQPYSSGTLRILFSGVDWERKGGDIAVEAVRMLNERGIMCSLTIVGPCCLPREITSLPFVDFVGYLNKNTEKDYQLYLNIWQSTHLFLLPTKAECAGIVFCEASGFGVPVVTYDTGGVGNYVVDGVNGYKLPLLSDAIAFADRIQSMIINKEFPILGKGGRQLYQTKLNWKTWGERFNKIIESSNLFPCNE